MRLAVSMMELTFFFLRANIFLPNSAMSLIRLRALRPRETTNFCERFDYSSNGLSRFAPGPAYCAGTYSIAPVAPSRIMSYGNQ